MDNEQLILSLSAYILNAYKKRQSIDQVYIRDLANIVISNLNLDYFISDITIGDLSKRTLACYYLDTKSIVIDLNKIIRRLVSINNPHINYGNRLLFYYLEVAEILLHEIEHSNQIKKIAYHEPNLEAKILTASAIFSYFRSDLNKYNLLIDLGYSEEQLKLYFNQKIMTYYNNYNIVPEERMANYYASLIIIKILKKFKNNHNLEQYKLYNFLKNILSGYDLSLNPTKEYLEQLGTAKILTKDEIDGENLSLDKRLILGLKISPEEKESLILLENKASKSL